MTNSLQERIQSGFDGQGLMTCLGAELSLIEHGHCNVSLPFHEGVTQQHGLFHGGVIATLADTAAGFAAYSTMTDGRQPLTVEFKINFIQPANGKKLEARASVLRAGRRILHLESKVYSLLQDREDLVAVALVTMASTSSVTQVR